jgi:DNA-directed RNA polymerase specialized sigma54-like protein
MTSPIAATLRQLMADDVSLECAHAEMLREHFHDRAAASTVEALMFGLRERGSAALQEAAVQRRLGELSEPQLHEICARLQKLNPEIAAPWSADKVEWLVEAWVACHGG